MAIGSRLLRISFGFRFYSRPLLLPVFPPSLFVTVRFSSFGFPSAFGFRASDFTRDRLLINQP